MSVAHQEVLRLGSVRIDSVVDLDPFVLPMSLLLPDADPAVLAPHMGWLAPRHMEGESLYLAVQSSVVRVGGKTILVDSCVGEHKPRPNRPDWHARADTGYLARLAALGLTPDQIDIVLCTHLHADHVGWNTVLSDGRWVPTFPRARYVTSRTEMDFWQAAIAEAQATGKPLPSHGAFLDSVEPVLACGQFDLVDGHHELAPGCHLVPLPGHTPGQVGLRVAGPQGEAVLAGDAIHHPAQLIAPHWSSGFCSDRALSARTRMDLLKGVAEAGAWLIPAHFRAPTACRLDRHGDGYLPLFADRP